MAQPIPPRYEIRDALAACDEGDGHGVEFRAVDPAEDRPGFDGYITTWNTVDSYGTAFARGAFKRTINSRLAVAPILANHDAFGGLPIGRHLSAKEDKTGVRISAALSETTAGQDALRLLRDGVPLGLSFGFDRIKDRSADEDDALDMSVAPSDVQAWPTSEIRVITEVRWWESSLVTFPANEKAKPDTIRSLDSTLSLLLAQMRDGELSPEQRALAERFVAAWNERPAPGEAHGTRSEQTRPDRRSDIAAALAIRARLLSQGAFL